MPQFPPQQQLNIYKYLKAGVIRDGTNVDFISVPTSCGKQDGGRQHLVGRPPPPSIPSGSLGASVPATAGLGQIKDEVVY